MFRVDLFFIAIFDLVAVLFDFTRDGVLVDRSQYDGFGAPGGCDRKTALATQNVAAAAEGAQAFAVFSSADALIGKPAQAFGLAAAAAASPGGSQASFAAAGEPAIALKLGCRVRGALSAREDLA